MQRQSLQGQYGRGVIRDVPRYQLPSGAVWTLTDFLVDLEGAPLQKRGGWKAGTALAGATSLNAVAPAPFSANNGICAIDNRGHLWFAGTPYAAQVLASSPSLYWRLGESLGAAIASDASVHGRNGTYGPDVTLGQAGALSGDTDTAARLDETIVTTSPGVTSTYSPFLTSSKRTFMGWAKRTATTNADTLIGGSGTVAVPPPRLFINSGNEDVVWNTSAGLVTWAAAWPATGVWVHWALTYDDSTRIAELFINGVSKGQLTVATAYGASTGLFRIGSYTETGVGPISRFNGYMDEVAVFESVLPGATITSLASPSGGTWVDKGQSVTTRQRPIFFKNLLITLPDGGTFTTPKKFDGTTISTMAMTGLTAVTPLWGTSYKSRLVIADTQTLYFSNVLDPETYDVLSFVKATDPIVGVAALSNMIAIFSAGRSERLRGTTPPSSTSAGDMTLEPMFPEGCIDARSLVVYSDQMVWANLNGVHISDGASHSNLVDVGGIRQYWDTLMQSYTPSWIFAGGIYRGRYILSITDGSGNFVGCFVCDLSSKTWLLLSNLPATMFAESQGASPELLMATANHNYIGYISACFNPDGNPVDGDGAPVQPSIEFPFFRMSTGKTRWRDLFLGVDLLSSSAYLEFWYTTSADSPNYTHLVDDAGNPVRVYGVDQVIGLDGSISDGHIVQRIPLHLQANGIGLKIVQVGFSQRTALFDLEAEFRDLEGRY